MGAARKVQRNRWREHAKKKIMKFPLFPQTLPGLTRLAAGTKLSIVEVPKLPRAVGELVLKRTNWRWWRDADQAARTAARAKDALAKVPGDV